jgi:hypothetical protein
VYSPLLPAGLKGSTWGGMMHASDWLPTFVYGIASLKNAKATGPRPLDGFDMWSVWKAGTADVASPRTEVQLMYISHVFHTPHTHTPSTTTLPSPRSLTTYL